VHVRYVAPRPQVAYTVEDGDHLSGIAESFGFHDYAPEPRVNITEMGETGKSAVDLFETIRRSQSLHSWTRPYGSMVCRKGRIDGRHILLEFAHPPKGFVDVLKALPFMRFRKMEPNPPEAGTCIWQGTTGTNRRISFRLSHILIEEGFPADDTYRPEEEVDVFLKWLVASYRGLKATQFVLAVDTAWDCHGDLPDVHGSRGDGAWRDLELLTLGQLVPSNGPLENFNFK